MSGYVFFWDLLNARGTAQDNYRCSSIHEPAKRAQQSFGEHLATKDVRDKT
jgi:hypothetical protein